MMREIERDEMCPCGHPELHHYSDSEDDDLATGYRGCSVYISCADPGNHRRIPHGCECRRCPCDAYWELIVETRWHGPST